ncbi:MAG: DUF4340 domain-containing protein [Bryobacterales bacterium]|nr:DUF4340 domain-containing protein [Bryobacterales bacterium]
MKLGRMLTAAFLLAVLGIVVWWSNQQEKEKEGKPASDAAPRILEIPPASVKEVQIQRRGEGPTTVQLNDKGNWVLTQPKPFQADSAAVAGITNTTVKLDSQRLVDPNATDLASYGLAPAMLEVKITQNDGKATKLLIGENTPANDAVYVKLDGDPRLFTFNTTNKIALNKDFKDLRDRHLFNFAQDKVSKIEVTARNQNFELSKPSDADWQISKPKAMRADSIQVDELITKLKNASMDANFSDDDAKKAAAAFGGASPVAVAKVTDPGGVKTFEVRKAKEDFYAKSSTLEGIYKVGKDVADGVDKPANDYRNKKVFDFGFGELTHVDVIDGARSSIFDKTGDAWLSAGKKMDSTSLQAFTDKLRDLTASKFADTGFGTPAVTITVVSNQGKHREKVEIAPMASGGNFLARHDGDASFYELEANTVKELRQASGDVREAQPEKKKK